MSVLPPRPVINRRQVTAGDMVTVLLLSHLRAFLVSLATLALSQWFRRYLNNQ
ncbi:MAG TPA: hypothetical protein G4O19_00950 [Dehalococcoidia bacterium]|nr:hypothetical protein [Dehalococcoidia bacterium]